MTAGREREGEGGGKGGETSRHGGHHYKNDALGNMHGGSSHQVQYTRRSADTESVSCILSKWQ